MKIKFKAIITILYSIIMFTSAATNNSFAEKKYTCKVDLRFTQAMLFWTVKPGVYTYEWEGGGGTYSAYCSGKPNGCFGIITMTVTNICVTKDSLGKKINPFAYPSDSLLMLGDDYVVGADTNSYLALIKMGDGTQGKFGDYYEIDQRTIFPLDTTLPYDPKDLRANISTPMVFPAQKARYSPDDDAFVAYFYKVNGN